MENLECKAGSTELTRSECEECYSNKKYIVNYSGVYQIHFSNANNCYYCSKIISVKGATKRGRFFAANARDVNYLLGEKVLEENL